MTKLDLPPQETITVDDIDYCVTAMPATEGLKFLEDNQDTMDSGKSDLAIMKKIICKWATIGSIAIDERKFNTHFSRRYAHMRKLYMEILKYNFPETEEGFQEPGTDE